MHARSIVDLRSVGRPTTTPARFFSYLVHLSPPPWFGLTVVRNVDRRGIEKRGGEEDLTEDESEGCDVRRVEWKCFHSYFVDIVIIDSRRMVGKGTNLL